MNVRRAAVISAFVALVAIPATPAFAHGAPVSPLSRTAACAANSSAGESGTAACKAARSANGGAFGSFDNLRVADVNGNDREFVPDGKLCSGGLDAFKGLDIARDDFPATDVTGGTTLAVKYEATLPHQGSFRVYITKQGYDATKKLAWGDLGASPIAEVKDPPLTGGAYRFSVKLPQRTGRQMLYIVWQTSSTADTYYSCSDLAFKAASSPSASPSPSPAATKALAKAVPTTKKSVSPTPAPSESSEISAAPVAAPDLTPVGDNTQVTLGHFIIAGAVVLALGALGWAGFGQIRRRRLENR